MNEKSFLDELAARMDDTQGEIENLRAERNTINLKIKRAEAQLTALTMVLEAEADSK